MRKTASEIIQDLEMRIARLELEDPNKETKVLETLFVQLDESFKNSVDLQHIINRDRELRNHIAEYIKIEGASRKKLQNYVKKRLLEA